MTDSKGEKSNIEAKPTFLGHFAVFYGVTFFSLLILNALFRLSPLAIEALKMDLSPFHWVAMAFWVVFMIYSEGYKGFQKQFSPRFASRARWLQSHPKPLYVLLAPFFCMGFLGATRKRKIVAWCLSLGIICLIVFVRTLPQPWRGIVDSGVVTGLAWGLASLWVWVWAVFFRGVTPVDPEL